MNNWSEKLDSYGQRIALRYKADAGSSRCLSGFEYTLFEDYLKNINKELKDKYGVYAVIDHNETDVFICFTTDVRDLSIYTVYEYSIILNCKYVI